MLKSFLILLSVSAAPAFSSPARILQRDGEDNIVSITDETNFWYVFSGYLSVQVNLVVPQYDRSSVRYSMAKAIDAQAYRSVVTHTPTLATASIPEA
jgi:hypothetical protein